jgi:peptidoglycan/LPS O-acetylase OafA/YrhL
MGVGLDIAKKRPHWLYSIAGLKAICLIGIFIWHIGYVKSPDLGARCVEVFFVASGFLEAYRHHYDYAFTFSETARFLKKKLTTFYPIHIVSLTIAVLLSLATGAIIFDGQTVCTIISFLTLTQSWFPSISTSSLFNGVSWFLSTLLVCYAMTPFIAFITKKSRLAAKQHGSKFSGEIVLFLLLFIWRMFLEVSQILFPKAFGNYSLAVSPLIRLPEYAMAYVAGCIFIERQSVKRVQPSYFHSSLIEVAYCAVLTVLVILNGGTSTLPGVAPRGIFVLLFILLIYLLAHGQGIISHLLSCLPFRLFAKIEMPFYMFHQVAIRLVTLPILISSIPILSIRKAYTLASFTLTIILSIGWMQSNKYIHKKCNTERKACSAISR